MNDDVRGNDSKPSEERGKIPTTFIALAPERIIFDTTGADVLCGVFHIMWSDMPTRRSYGLRLADKYSWEGERSGCFLICTFPLSNSILCETL